MNPTFITVVMKVPDNGSSFFNVFKLGCKIYDGEVTAMAMSDEISKLERLEDLIMSEYAHDARLLSIINEI